MKFKKPYKVCKKGIDLLRNFEKGYDGIEHSGVWGEYLGKVPYSLNSLVLMFQILTDPKGKTISVDIVKDAIEVMKVFMNHAFIIYSSKDTDEDEGEEKIGRIEQLVKYMKKNVKGETLISKIKNNSNLHRTHDKRANVKEIKEAALLGGFIIEGDSISP